MRSITRFLALAAMVLGAQCAWSQNWPTKPVRFIIPTGTGGSSDQIARILGDRLAAALGQPFLNENRPGGNGVAGTSYVAKSPADGYTFLFAFDFHSTNPSLQKDLPYDKIGRAHV